MIRVRPQLLLDAQGKEIFDKGREPFNLVVNDVSAATHGSHWKDIIAHWHRELELFRLEGGRVRIQAGTEEFALEPGQACFFNTGVLHSMDLCGDWHYLSYVFGADIVSGAPGSVFDTRYVLPLLTEGPAFLVFPEREGRFSREFDRVYEACGGEAMGFEFEARTGLSRMTAMIAEKARLMPARRATGEQEARVKEMMSWIEENLGREITVGDIAGAAHVCPRTCQKAFQRYLHCSPVEYLQRRRILSAAQRLASTSDPVTDIAFDCGFSSHSYFSKSFKAVMGSTPVEYRAAAGSSSQP